MGEWSLTVFGEVAQRHVDITSPADIPPHTPYIGLEHIEPNALRVSAWGTAGDTVSPKLRFDHGDVIYGKLRPYFRKVCRPRQSGVCTTEAWVLRPRRGVDPHYLFYLAALPAFSTYATSSSDGTRMPRAQWDHVASYPVLLPPLSEQRAIAEVLGALDDKIEANHRLAALCDSTWHAIAASELEGELVPLSSLARFVNGGAYTKGASGTGRVVIRTPELTSGPTGSTIYSDRDVPADQLARPGDLLFVWSGSLAVHRWFRTEAIINQHIFKVIPGAGVPVWLVHDRILGLLPEFISIAADKATTMGHIQRHHLDTPVLRPSADKLAVLDDACAPLWKRALTAERESLALTQLRDSLLPKLVSGELRVLRAEVLVEDAV